MKASIIPKFSQKTFEKYPQRYPITKSRVPRPANTPFSPKTTALAEAGSEVHLRGLTLGENVDISTPKYSKDMYMCIIYIYTYYNILYDIYIYILDI